MGLRAGATMLERSTGQPIALPIRSLRESLSGFGWAALSVTVFSGWFLVTRISVTRELRVWDVMALRFGIGALVLLPVLFGRAARLPRRAWREGLLFAALWGAPFVFFVAFSLQSSSAAQASAVTPALMPVFAGLIGWLALRERPGELRLLGYVIITGGLAALVAGNALSEGRFNLGGIASLTLAAALPLYLAFGLSRLSDASLQELTFQAVYQGFLMSAVAFNGTVTLLGAAAAAAIIALLPVIVAALAVPVLGEIPSEIDFVAIGSIAADSAAYANRPANGQVGQRRRRSEKVELP